MLCGLCFFKDHLSLNHFKDSAMQIETERTLRRAIRRHKQKNDTGPAIPRSQDFEIPQVYQQLENSDHFYYTIAVEPIHSECWCFVRRVVLLLYQRMNIGSWMAPLRLHPNTLCKYTLSIRSKMELLLQVCLPCCRINNNKLTRPALFRIPVNRIRKQPQSKISPNRL